jgi:IPT/TIG domain
VHQGTLLRTIDIPEKWGGALDVLAIDKFGTRIFGLTAAGVIEIQLASAPLSLGQIIPATGVVGTSITLNGSGFVSGSSVTIGGQPATSTVLDANTIQSIVPALTPGTYPVVISKPNGDRYSLDSAFVVN